LINKKVSPTYIFAILTNERLKNFLLKSYEDKGYRIYFFETEAFAIKELQRGSKPGLFIFEVPKKMLSQPQILKILQQERQGHVEGNFVPFIGVSEEEDIKLEKKIFEWGGTDFFSMTRDLSILRARIKKELESLFNYHYMISEHNKLRKKHIIQHRLNEFAKRMQTLTDEHILNDHIPTFLRSIFEIGLYSFYEYNPEKKTLKLLSHNHKDLKKDVSIEITPPKASIMWNTIIKKDATLVENIRKTIFFNPMPYSGKYTGKSVLCIPIIFKDTVRGIINMTNKKNDEPFTDWDVEMAKSFAEHIASQREIIQNYKKIEKLSRFDPLTGILNRRVLLEKVETEFAKAKRYSSTMSVVMGDIDFFKQVNDTYGHVVGDFILKNVALVIRDNIREKNVDIFGRYGGEEFLLCFPNVCKHAAYKAVNRIREILQDKKFVIDNMTVRVTMSFGISGSESSDKEVFEIIKRADEALYYSKRNGRNLVSL